VGVTIAAHGHTVVSGNAQGADQLYAHGANHVNEKLVELCIPWWSYEQQARRPGNLVRQASPTTKQIQLAEQHHPNWTNLSRAVRSLMIRNAMIITDPSDIPVQHCIALLNHSKRGGGGTGHGVRISRALGVPVWDLATPGVWEQLKEEAPWKR
jgi:hypothetical protein